MRKEDLTYPSVATVCELLLKEGVTPSVRKIHAKTGGSLSTISGFLSSWQEQHTLAASVETELSEPLRTALFAEFGRVTAQLKQQLNEQLAQERAQLQEARELLAEQEIMLNELKQQLETSTETQQQQEVHLKGLLSAAQARIEDGEKRELQQQQSLSELREQKHAADIRATRAETKTEELEKQLEAFSKKEKHK